ncbi:MAG: sodium:calcium antiporter [Phycisphaerae bacterium]
MISTWIYGADLPTWALFTELFVAGLCVVLAGSRFSRLADDLAQKLGIASGWIGLILLATVTSLPEVVTGGTATWIGNPGMAIAALFGSCSFNITILVLLNAVVRGGSVLRDVSGAHTLTSSFGLLLMGLALFGVVLGEKFAASPRIAQVCEGFWSVAILAAYLGCMRLTYRYERRGASEAASGGRARMGPALGVQLGAVALAIVVAAWWLAQIGDTLCVHEIALIGRPLGETFVGAGFLALATSLPEITTSIAAVRLGNINLALGNIFGSNMFNIFVIPIIKGVSLVRGDPLLLTPGRFDTVHVLIAGLMAVMLTAIAVGGLTYKSRHKMLGRFGMGFDSVLIALVYVGGMVLLVMEAD